MQIKAVLFDVIGTTVLERDPNTVNSSFEKALHDHGILVDPSIIKANRGKDKREAISQIIAQKNYPKALVEPVFKSFKKNLENNLNNFYENEGFTEIFRFLHAKKIFIGIGSGLPNDIFDKIFHYLNWTRYPFDYIGTAENIGKGRPNPDMIFDMMKKVRVNEKHFLKVGDTIADIEEGKNAKVLTCAIVSGTTREMDLKSKHPDFMIYSLLELIEILEKE